MNRQSGRDNVLEIVLSITSVEPQFYLSFLRNCIFFCIDQESVNYNDV